MMGRTIFLRSAAIFLTILFLFPAGGHAQSWVHENGPGGTLPAIAYGAPYNNHTSPYQYTPPLPPSIRRVVRAPVGL